MATLTLHQINRIPEGLLEIDARDLTTLLPGPTLLHLEGKEAAPMFVSVLLHGNEITGLLAIQRLLKKYQTHPLPRSLSIFFGNLEAANAGLRRLPGQPDYNRVWPGTEHSPCPEVELMRQVWQIMAARRVHASIDIHNNTGRNPHYACINRLDWRFLQLAYQFGRLIVYFLRPKGVQSMAFAELCPAVTLECGKPGIPQGTDHVCDYLETCLHLSAIPNHPLPPENIDLFHTVALIKIREGITFSFTDDRSDVLFRSDLDHLNFLELPAGITLGEVHCDTMPLLAIDDAGRDVTQRYFSVKDGKLALVRKVMPSMFTLDEKIIQLDCLGYLMERLPLAKIGSGPA